MAAEHPRGGLVTDVDPEGPAWRAGLRPGDLIETVAGLPARDVLDLMWAADDGLLDLRVRRGRRIRRIVIELDEGGGFGFELLEPLFDGIRRCPNRCVFCFVDQQPPGLRPSLYVKDEDYRLSFLSGSYVTMTNLRPEDVRRIEELHLSPLYVSVHSTDDEVRRRLLGRRRLPPLLPLIDRLGEAGIAFHAQIVLVPGWNDGMVLRSSLEDLVARYPVVQGTAVVPVGLTGHRSDLPPLKGVDARCARRVLDVIDDVRLRARELHGSALVYGADELFLRARRPLPPASYYEDFALLENGVGLLRRFLDETTKLVRRRRPRPPHQGPRTALVTGAAAAPFFRDQVLPLLRPLGVPPTDVVTVRNRLLGPSVTVAGLLSGEDVAHALRGTTYEHVLLPACTLRDGTGRFLDGLTVADLEARLNAVVTAVDDDPRALLTALLEGGRNRARGSR